MKTMITTLIVLCLLPFGVFGATYTVANNNDSGPGSLRQAIADAEDGDVITFDNSYTIELTSGSLIVDKSLTITGTGAGNTVIQCNFLFGIFRIAHVNNITVTLEDMTVQNGSEMANNADRGGGIYVYNANLTLNRMAISNCKAKYGGGLFIDLISSVTINACTINDNLAIDYVTGQHGGQGGGIWIGNLHSIPESQSSLTMVNTTITDNISENTGGIFLYGTTPNFTANIKNSTIANNAESSGLHSGGIYDYGLFQLSLKNSILANNWSAGSIHDFLLDSEYSFLTTDNGYNIVGVSEGFAWEENSDWTDQDGDGTYTNYGTSDEGSLNLSSGLANNGGPTETLKINSSSSVATANGLYGSTVPTDQRGYGRHIPPTIGAYEYDYNTIWSWTGASSSDWTTPGNWNPAVVPSLNDNVEIYPLKSRSTYPTIANGEAAGCDGLTVYEGASLGIESGGSLTCGDLTIQSAASFTVGSGGSLITNGSVNGSVDVELWVDLGEWHLISVPNSNTTANTFLGDYLQYWSEPDQSYYDITDPATSMTPAQGYCLWDQTMADAYTFSGTPNTGIQEIGMTNNYSGWYQGCNLVGNPYPSSIDWATLHESYGTAYLWNPDGMDYNEITSGDIAPMQGFFVYSEWSPILFQLDNSNRSHGGTFLKEKTIIKNSLVLYVTYNDFEDKFTLIIDDEAEEGFSLTDDAWKMLSTYDGVSQLWSVCPDGKLAIDKRPATDYLQLGFANDTPGFYSIGISQIADITTATLEDTKENTFTDLTKGAYSFAWETTDDESRFILHLGPTGVSALSQPDNLLIYTSGKTLYLKPLEGSTEGTLRMTDMAGRTLWQEEMQLEGLTTVPVNLKPGLYVVSFQSDASSAVKKVIIN